MALSLTNLFTATGEIIKKVDIFNTLITSLNTYKGDIYTDLAAGDFEDKYVPIPNQFVSFQNSVAGWINTIKSDVTSVLLAKEQVVDELPIYTYTITSVLNGLYDYMEDNSETIKSSVVTLGGSDADIKASATLTFGAADRKPILFASRTLDGVSSPGNGVSAHIRYDGKESQLAMSSTVTAELLSNTTVGSESAILFAESAASASYSANPESPGSGPTLRNPETANLITSNAKFNAWTGDAPTGWSMSGTITTDYEDASGTGSGPLQMNTQGVTALKQVTGLTHNKLYFLGIYCQGNSGDTDAEVVGVKLRTAADSSIVTQVTVQLDEDNSEPYGVAFQFFRLPTTVDLTDIYVELEYVTKGHASSYAQFHKVVIAPVTYWNGLAWVWWPYYHTAADKSMVALGTQTSLAVANNNAGKFQTFFRRAYNIQLPTADSPSISDTLAGGS